MTKIHVASQKQIIKTPYFKITEEHVRIGDQKDVYYSFHRVPTVKVFPITSNHEIYLISEYRFLYKKRCLASVAGHVDEGESPLAAAIRELEEEIGLQANSWEQILKTELAGSSIKA